MALPRERVVIHLMNQASDAMSDACKADPSISGEEVISTYLTLAKHALTVARRGGADTRRLQAVVQELLLECIGDSGHGSTH